MPRPSRKTFDRGTFRLTSDTPVGVVWEGVGELESSLWEVSLRERTEGVWRESRGKSCSVEGSVVWKR